MRMLRFFREYSAVEQSLVPPPGAPTHHRPKTTFELSIVQQSMGQLPWSHNVILFEKLAHLPTRIWYARQTLQEGWSRDTLIQQIKQSAHQRQGTAVTNFATTLPDVHANLAQGLLKDPYLFDFLTIEEPFHERELETGLLTHVQKFLLELGRGFSFVGRQYELSVADQDYYLDLLFYHLQLRWADD